LKKIVTFALLLALAFLFASETINITEITGKLAKQDKEWKIQTADSELSVHFGTLEELQTKEIELKEALEIKANCIIIDDKLTVLNFVMDEKEYQLRDEQGKWIEVAKGSYKVAAEQCIGCNLCPSRCPVNSISMVKGKAVIDADTCIDCGLCVDSCPVGAISN